MNSRWLRRLPLIGLMIVTGASAVADIRPVVGTYSTLKVKRGDTLQSIARREDVNSELLSRLNHLRSGRVRPGQTLTLPTLHILPRQPKDGIVLNIPERQVYLFRQGQMKAVYPVAVGKAAWPTETGEFTLISKVTNPRWKPTKEMVNREDIKDDPVPPGKDNPVGDRWMGWSKKGFGFHSTKAPASIGKAISHGCVRLYPESAHKMFDLVKEGEPIFSMYEPITVGRREDKYYLSVFPDIYHKNLVSVARARSILQKEGLLSRVNMNEVARIVHKQLGYPQSLHLHPANKQAAKKHPAGKSAAKPAPVKKQAASKPAAKRATAKKANAKKAPVQKAPAKKQAGSKASEKSTQARPSPPAAPPEMTAEDIAMARRQGQLLVGRYRSGQVVLLNTVRDLAELEQLANQGYLNGANHRPRALAPSLRQALARLANRTSRKKPLALLSLYRPFDPARPLEPHSNGLAADIAAFDGHTIDNRHPGEAVAGVMAILKALPPGQYRFGLPKPPDSDPEALLAPPERPRAWPFFPAPEPEVAQIGAATLVMPHFDGSKPATDSHGRFRPEVTCWANERAIPLSEIGEPRLRKAFASCSRNGVQVVMAFPDAADHLHIDVAVQPAFRGAPPSS